MTPLEMLLTGLAQCEIVDLSTDVTVHARGPFETQIEVLEAEPGARHLVENVVPHMAPQLAGRIRPQDFPGGAFLRHEMVKASVHAGSHVDAPGHYGGALGPGSFINDADVRDFIGPGVLFDGYSVEGPVVRWDDIEGIGRRQGNMNVAGKIVLIRTGPERAIAREVIENLLDRGVNLIGTDSASFDGPFGRMFKLFTDTNDSSALFPCHVLGRSRPYYQMENLSNLDRLPPQGFIVWAPPVMIQGATGAWTRILALVPRTGDGGSPDTTV